MHLMRLRSHSTINEVFVFSSLMCISYYKLILQNLLLREFWIFAPATSNPT